MKRANAIPTKGKNPAAYLMEQAMREKQREDRVMKAAFKAVMLLSMMTLHDKFGFGKKRLEKFFDEVFKLLEAYNEGYVDVKDFESVLWQECGIRIDILAKGAAGEAGTPEQR